MAEDVEYITEPDISEEEDFLLIETRCNIMRAREIT